MDAESRRMRETSFEGKKLSSSVQSFSDTRFAFIIIILEFVARFSSCLKELYGWKLDGRIRVLRYPKLPVDTKHLGEQKYYRKYYRFWPAVCTVSPIQFPPRFDWQSRSNSSEEEWLMYKRDASRSKGFQEFLLIFRRKARSLPLVA